jgi:hypothetical protein
MASNIRGLFFQMSETTVGHSQYRDAVLTSSKKLLQSVVRGFFGDDDVVDVRFFQAG